jgi:hypothetical protein
LSKSNRDANALAIPENGNQDNAARSGCPAWSRDAGFESIARRGATKQRVPRNEDRLNRNFERLSTAELKISAAFMLHSSNPLNK